MLSYKRKAVISFREKKGRTVRQIKKECLKKGRDNLKNWYLRVLLKQQGITNITDAMIKKQKNKILLIRKSRERKMS
jgi:hypothetical protein